MAMAQENVNHFTGVPYTQRYHEIYNERTQLPVWHYKKAFFQALTNNKVIVLVGETGSGKTTQIPQWSLEWLRNIKKDERPEGSKEGAQKSVVCTQTRSKITMCLAKIVAEQMDVALGNEVGYSIRFNDRTSNRTILKYLTDDILLREAKSDPLLEKYGVVVVDNAHERTLCTDIVLGLLKQIAEKRPNLRIVVMSAIPDTRKFQEYFDDAPLLNVSTPVHPVEIIYSAAPRNGYLLETFKTVIKIHKHEEEGNILVFLKDSCEVDEAYLWISRRSVRLAPNYGRLQCIRIGTKETGIFKEPQPCRSNEPISRTVVLTTNIAEACITISDIVFVVDTGIVKMKVFDPEINAESIQLILISKVSANQRASHAGRIRPGKCFRIYTEDCFENQMEENTRPEVLRLTLRTLVLQLEKFGISVNNFNFLDFPDHEALSQAIFHLKCMGALGGNDLKLTDLGSMMAEFPIDPRLSKALIASCSFNCSQEILSIVAMLSVPQCFDRPFISRDESAIFKENLSHTKSDHLTMLNVYEHLKQRQTNTRPYSKNDYTKSFNQFIVNDDPMKAVFHERVKLGSIMTRFNLPHSSTSTLDENHDVNIGKALLSGFFMQVAHLADGGHYLTVNDVEKAHLDPSTYLDPKPRWVLYNQIAGNNITNFMRTVCEVNIEWLREVAPEYYAVHEHIINAFSESG